MSRAVVETLLMALEHAWDHTWEALVGVLAGVEENEAAWSAPAYDDVERRGGAPKPGSIHWHVNHLAGCKLYYISRLANILDPGSPPRENDLLEPEATYAEERARLESILKDEVNQIASLEDDDLERPVSAEKSLTEFIVATTRHDTWHAGQIAVARRLYARAKSEANQ